MNKELIFDAMDYIDDDMLADVDLLRSGKMIRKSRIWMRYTAVAACACIIFCGVFAASRFLYGDIHLKNDSAAEEMIEIGADGSAGGVDNGSGGVYVPKSEVSLESGQMADMIGFFIYEGRMYTFYETVEENDRLMGEYVGTATGLIDEWTPTDGYVDFAGSVSGDFYTVNGYDPSFMLCMKRWDGEISVYINDSGMTMYRGADLFYDRLHLAGNYTKVEYQTRHDWYNSLGNIKTLPDASYDTLEKFIVELNHGYFMYNDDVLKDESGDHINEIYSMFFSMNNGLTVHIRLYDGGYVSFDGIRSVCVKMDVAAFNKLISVLK